MCGIYGVCGLEAPPPVLAAMDRVLRHRGPDSSGQWTQGRMALGMRRLSIIDTATGDQPIFNEDQGLVIVYNGETYNYRELTQRLVKSGHRFTTRSDTECVIHLYEEQGPGALEQLRGMFAFAIAEPARERLFLARDRLGVKPLYYWRGNGGIIFASEIKAILEHPLVTVEPDPAAMDAYLSLRYVPGPGTIFKGIYKLPAGHWLRWERGEVKIQRYWEPSVRQGPYQDDEYYQERFDDLLREAVDMRLVGEVPVGCFLSGGLDSTALSATMASLVNRPINTFSIGFEGATDERAAARAVAKSIGSDHHDFLCRPEDFSELPRIVYHMDEPLGDAIILPMFLLSRRTRQEATVVLSGEGADEVLAGYLMHKTMMQSRRLSGLVPDWFRGGVLKPLVSRLPVGLLDRFFDYPGSFGEQSRDKLARYLEVMGWRDPLREYHFLISLFDRQDKASLYAGPMRALVDSEPLGPLALYPEAAGGDYLSRVLSLQYAHWLPDDILTKLDKMTMANSLEGRVPFLDHVLVEFLLATPSHLKLKAGRNKILLRDYVARKVPGGYADRRKQAFYIPTEQFLQRGPLSEMMGQLLNEDSVRRRGLFDWPRVRWLIQCLDRREFIFAKQVYSLLTLELWHRIFVDREPGWV